MEDDKGDHAVSVVHKGNLEEAQNIVTEKDKTKGWAQDVECPWCGMGVTPVCMTTMAHYTWIFPVYLKHIAVIVERIETSIPLWRKEKGMGADGRLDRLEQLQEDLTDQLSSIEENWDEATNNVSWSQADTVEEKKIIARIVQDFRSWGREALCKIKDFQEEETEWGRHDAVVMLQYQKWEKGTDINDMQTNISSIVEFQRWWVLKSKIFAMW